MRAASEHHIVKKDGKYQLTIFKHGHLIKKGEYSSYAEAMQALIKHQKGDPNDTR